ncbi:MULTISPECIES: DNA-methyltransferase [Stenotrophomonas]|uniref:DNA-methyltransferase n=1 Tax=Stenotrophomonas TaxID=40323 RepID=UPI000A979C07|nr:MULTISPECIES: site-specific DNA-methyltransferase [Stenotrophomonas]MCU1002748.1 site-specific DNA-methyltransferase [Stenotrophomonas maltophilia]QGL98782.1 site-specific DNA-methyltransferase [Stenotrophomonas maltophilia]
MPYRRATAAWSHLDAKEGSYALLNGDCVDLLRALPDESVSLVATSPPYCMGKEYEAGNTIDDFILAHDKILPEILRVVKPGGSICWQVGYHVDNSQVMPLDYLVMDAMRKLADPPVLRNRIIWTFGHGYHCERRFSGRHETILWYTKGGSYPFDLDSVRVPQLYPGKTANKGPLKGLPSGNPLGKNPGDVWDIPNVKWNHVEKLDHPCQFPVALISRLVNSMTLPGDIVLDPFAGVATTGVASLLAGRRFIGAELDSKYADIADKRLREAVEGTVRVREDKPVQPPSPRSKLAIRPDNFKNFDAL